MRGKERSRKQGKKRCLIIGHIRILTVVQETSMKERLMRGNLLKCKLFPPREPLSHARSSPTVRIRIGSIVHASTVSLLLSPTSTSNNGL